MPDVPGECRGVLRLGRAAGEPTRGVYRTCGEYAARCDCCKTFRNTPDGVLPKAHYDNTVRQAVQNLGATAVQARTQRRSQLTRTLVRQCKRRKFRSKVADSTGADLTVLNLAAPLTETEMSPTSQASIRQQVAPMSEKDYRMPQGQAEESRRSVQAWS